MTVEPAETPVTTPPASTVATAGFVDDQTPPAVASASVLVDPTQRLPPLVMAATTGRALTVSVSVVSQPVDAILYLIRDVPAVTGVTTPAALIVATAGVPLVQVPPAIASDSARVEPTQTALPPIIAEGD
jgi:hypothetical protein